MATLHVVETSKILESYLKFLKKNFNVEDHHIVVWDTKVKYFNFNKEMLSDFNVYYISRYNILDAYMVAELCKNYNRIIFHSLYFPLTLMLIFSIKRKFLFKSIWVIWGGDLSNYIGNIDFKRKMWSVLRNRLIKKIGFVITTNAEYSLLVNNFNVQPIRMIAFYPYLAEQLSINGKTKNNSKCTNIFIGNYATRANRHLEVINLLSKYADENIKIYIPLSYGDSEYAEEIKLISQKKFGDKVINLMEFIDADKYSDLISSIDIGIINSLHQRALGSIFSLILNNAKIYIDPHSDLWEILSNEMGIIVYPINQINDESFKEFINIESDILLKNEKKASHILSSEKIKEQWEKVFSINPELRKNVVTGSQVLQE